MFHYPQKACFMMSLQWAFVCKSNTRLSQFVGYPIKNDFLARKNVMGTPAVDAITVDIAIWRNNPRVKSSIE